LRSRHCACLRRRRRCWHSGAEHVYCRAPTRVSGWNHRRQIEHGRLHALAIAAIGGRPGPAGNRRAQGGSPNRRAAGPDRATVRAGGGSPNRRYLARSETGA